jgi:acyl-CoA synthetase (AMP-forming)/AMP-acid ligase II
MAHDRLELAHLERARTLLEAVEMPAGGASAPALTYIETGLPAVTVTRGAFHDEVRRYARALSAAGIGAGDLVLVAHDDTLAVTYMFWGLLRIGAVPSLYTVPTDRLFPEVYMANVAALVEQIDARAVVTLDALAADFARLGNCPVIGFSRVQAALPSPAAPPPEVGLSPEAGLPPGAGLPPDDADPAPHAAASDDVAYVQTSSGTTGAQRCVPTTHRMVLSQVAALARRMDVRPDDVIANWMPLYHDGGLIFGVVMPLLCRVPCVLMSPIDWVRHPEILLRSIREHGGTFFNMPNFAFNHMARRIRERDMEGVRLDGVRGFVNGSERVYHTSFENFLGRFGPLGATRDRLGVAYGMAENTLMVTHTRTGTPVVYDAVDRARLELEQVAAPLAADDPGAVVNVSCGPPLEGVEVFVFDDNDLPLPERRVGQVAIRSRSLFSGYYRRPELTAELFRDDIFLTGDMGYVAGGELYIVGRLKDLIINGGKNLYPADIEEIATSIPGVRPGRVAVFGVPDEAEGTELIALVAEVDAQDPGQRAEIERAIRRAVLQRMSLTLGFVDILNERWVIKTSSGKTSRAACRRKWLEARPSCAAPPHRTASSRRSTATCM